MKFAQFQSTYKGSPLDVYEKTGEILEAKYFKNREENTLLRQTLSNINVEDRNIGHLAKATTDIESILDSVNGEWQYATNALYEAKQRLIGDKALAASMEDYAKSQATKAEMQKRFEENKIGQDALNAYYINEKRYNTKSIEVDENGQAKNRWFTPTSPQKTDVEEKVLKIVTLLNQHKDSLVVGANAKGTPLYEAYQANPGLEGFVNRITAKGKTPERIAEAVNAWIQTTPEIKDYYNYINDAYTFDQLALKDSNGSYIKGENENIIQRDITPEDFRQLGISVADDWESLNNKVYLPGVNGVITSSTIRAMSPNLKDTPAYKELREEGLSDQAALRKLYVASKTNLETDKIVDFSRSFAFSEFDTDVIKDEGYWFRKNLEKENEKNRIINSAWVNKAPLLPDNGFSVEGLTKTINDLEKAISSTKEGSYDRYRLTAQLDGIKATQKTLRQSYAQTPEGAAHVEKVYQELLNSVPDNQWSIIKNGEKQIKQFISGERDDLGVNINGSTSVKKTRFLLGNMLDTPNTPLLTEDITLNNVINTAITEFDKGYEKRLQKGGLNHNINTYDFLDENNAITEIGENLGTNIINRADSWHNLAALNKQGQPMTLVDFMDEHGINETLYKPVAQYTDLYGTFAIKFIPNKPDIKPLPNDGRIIIKPNPENVDAIMEEQLRSISALDKGKSQIVNNWINQQTGELIYGYTFGPARSQYNTYVKLGNITNVEIPLHDVRLSKNNNERTECKLRINDNFRVTLFQLDPKTGTYVSKGEHDDLNAVQSFLTSQFLK